MRPNSSEHHPYFSTYIDLVPEVEIVPVLQAQTSELECALGNISFATATMLHEPYTWSLRQVVGHCIDTERIFGYRISRFAVGDTTELPGFDQNEFVSQTDYTRVNMTSLLEEFSGLRISNLKMLERFSEEIWDRNGTADGHLLSVRAGAYILAGHIRHHLGIMKKRLSLAN